MDVSICVIFRNSEVHLPRLLKSFQNFPIKDFSCEYVFVDNASTDRSADLVKGFPDSIYHYRSANHMGQARNDALRLSRANWIYFIDSDCELLSNTFSELLKEVNTSDITIAGWGGAQIFPQITQTLILLDQFRQNYLGHFGSVQMMQGDQNQFVEHLSTSHVLYRKSALLEVSGFNPNLRDSAEDLDLSLRLRKCGFRLMFIPKSKIEHHLAHHMREWIYKAWRNGQWQTRLVFYNTEILKSRRFWISHLVLILLFFQWLTLFFIFLYVVVVFWIGCRSQLTKIRMKIQLMGLYFCTHLLYLFGGWVGLLLGFTDWVFSKINPIIKLK